MANSKIAGFPLNLGKINQATALEITDEINGKNSWSVPNKRKYGRLEKDKLPRMYSSDATIWNCLYFAAKMAYEGNTRESFAGSNFQRNPGEILKDQFRGKLAECAVYQILVRSDLPVRQPDLNVYSLGWWDSGDLQIVNHRGETINISVKSTKHYGQLLLLETDSWDKQGRYKYGNGLSGQSGPYCPDYFALVLIEIPDIFDQLVSISQISQEKWDKYRPNSKIPEPKKAWEKAIVQAHELGFSRSDFYLPPDSSAEEVFEKCLNILIRAFQGNALGGATGGIRAYIPGVINVDSASKSSFCKDHILRKGDYLGKMQMKTENYYICASDFDSEIHRYINSEVTIYY